MKSKSLIIPISFTLFLAACKKDLESQQKPTDVFASSVFNDLKTKMSSNDFSNLDFKNSSEYEENKKIVLIRIPNKYINNNVLYYYKDTGTILVNWVQEDVRENGDHLLSGHVIKRDLQNKIIDEFDIIDNKISRKKEILSTIIPKNRSLLIEEPVDSKTLEPVVVYSNSTRSYWWDIGVLMNGGSYSNTSYMNGNGGPSNNNLNGSNTIVNLAKDPFVNVSGINKPIEVHISMLGNGKMQLIAINRNPTLYTLGLVCTITNGTLDLTSVKTSVLSGQYLGKYTQNFAYEANINPSTGAISFLVSVTTLFDEPLPNGTFSVESTYHVNIFMKSTPITVTWSITNPVEKYLKP